MVGLPQILVLIFCAACIFGLVLEAHAAQYPYDSVTKPSLYWLLDGDPMQLLRSQPFIESNASEIDTSFKPRQLSCSSLTSLSRFNCFPSSQFFQNFNLSRSLPFHQTHLGHPWPNFHGCN